MMDKGRCRLSNSTSQEFINIRDPNDSLGNCGHQCPAHNSTVRYSRAIWAQGFDGIALMIVVIAAVANEVLTWVLVMVAETVRVVKILASDEWICEGGRDWLNICAYVPEMKASKQVDIVTISWGDSAADIVINTTGYYAQGKWTHIITNISESLTQTNASNASDDKSPNNSLSCGGGNSENLQQKLDRWRISW